MKSSGRRRRARQTRMARKAQKSTNVRKAAEKAGREPRVQRYPRQGVFVDVVVSSLVGASRAAAF
jgi:hypothetical protein